MEISIYTGTKQIKTRNHTYISGMSESSTVPSTVGFTDYINYNGKYYVPTNKREEYLRDKSE